ncbi:MAG: D-alanyl-D-alanine-carboxypeptidase/endopeptidase AmpH [Candidatus Anoxychlamydiales bacterium]|nr:D-alanyl-D-alanine-carboxypeptidase/endopeptidase AmpH [Candidatus Anoxychlamydiales bacterium]
MKKIKSVILLLLFIPFFAFSITGEEIQSLIDKSIEEGHSQGMVIGIISKDKTIFYKNGKLGINNDKLMDENTIFETGSITKIFTSLLLAIMVRDGDVRMDDPVEKFMPPHVRTPSYLGQKITLANLATHTAGFPYLPDNFYPNDLYNPFCKYSYEEFYTYLSNYELKYAPGSKYQYSNVCIGFLCHALTLSSQKNFEELLIEKITSKLDMNDTRVKFTDDMLQRYADAHIRDKKVPHWGISTFEGNGALKSSAKDLARFIEANLGYYKSDLFDVLQTALIDRCPQDLPYLDVGLEWNIAYKYNPEIIYHGGIVGGQQVFVGFCPQREIGVVIVSNSSANISDIGKHVLNKKWHLNEYRQQATLMPLMLYKFIGDYKNDEGERDIKISMLDLGHLSTLMFKTGYYPAVKLYPSSDYDFFLKVMPVNVKFSYDENNNITGLTVDHDGKIFNYKKVK